MIAAVFPRCLAGAALIVALAGPQFASATVEKIMRVCNGQLCPFFRASFSVPDAWFEDVKTGHRLQLRVFIPKGESFDTAPAMIYAMARPNPEKDNVAAVVASHHDTWRQRVPDVAITRLSDVSRPGGLPFQHHQFVATTLAAQPFERVATTIDTDMDGNTFIVRLVLTAKSETALSAGEATFLTMLMTY